jgi:hypothetical protein
MHVHAHTHIHVYTTTGIRRAHGADLVRARQPHAGLQREAHLPGALGPRRAAGHGPRGAAAAAAPRAVPGRLRLCVGGLGGGGHGGHLCVLPHGAATLERALRGRSIHARRDGGGRGVLRAGGGPDAAARAGWGRRWGAGTGSTRQDAGCVHQPTWAGVLFCFVCGCVRGEDETWGSCRVGRPTPNPLRSYPTKPKITARDN